MVTLRCKISSEEAIILCNDGADWWGYRWHKQWTEKPWCWVSGEFAQCGKDCKSNCPLTNFYIMKWGKGIQRPVVKLTLEQVKEIIEKSVDIRGEDQDYSLININNI